MQWSTTANAGGLFATVFSNGALFKTRTGLTASTNYWVYVTAQDTNDISLAESGWVAFTTTA